MISEEEFNKLPDGAAPTPSTDTVPSGIAPWANPTPPPKLPKVPEMSEEAKGIASKAISGLGMGWNALVAGPTGLVTPGGETSLQAAKGLGTGLVSGSVGIVKGAAGDLQAAGEYIQNTPPHRMNSVDFVGKGLEVIGKDLQKKPSDDFNMNKFRSFVNPAIEAGMASARAFNKELGKGLEGAGKVLQAPSDILESFMPEESRKPSPEQQGIGQAIAETGKFAYDYWDQQQKSNRFMKSPDPQTDPVGYWAHQMGSVVPQVVGQYYFSKVPFQYMAAEKAMDVAKLIGIGGMGLNEAGGMYADARRAGLTPEQAMTYTGIYEPISMLLENGPFEVIFAGNRKMFLDNSEKLIGKNLTSKLFKNPFMDKAAKNRAVSTLTHLFFSGTSEGAEEVSQQVVEYIVGDMGGYRHLADMSNGMIESFAGGFFGGMVGLPLAHMPATFKERFQNNKSAINSAVEKMKEAGVPQQQIDNFSKAAISLSKATLEGGSSIKTSDIRNLLLSQKAASDAVKGVTDIKVPDNVKANVIQQESDKTLHEKLTQDILTGESNPSSVNVGQPTPQGPARISFTREGSSDSVLMQSTVPGGEAFKTALGAIDAYNQLRKDQDQAPLELSTMPHALQQLLFATILSNSDMGRVDSDGFENIVRYLDKINKENYVFVGAGDVTNPEINCYYQNFHPTNGPLTVTELATHLITKGVYPDELTVIGLEGGDHGTRQVHQVIETLKERFKFQKPEGDVTIGGEASGGTPVGTKPTFHPPSADILLDISNISNEREASKHKGDHAWNAFEEGYAFANSLMQMSAEDALEYRKIKDPKSADYKGDIEREGGEFIGVTDGFQKKDGTTSPALIQFRAPGGTTLALKSTDFSQYNVRMKLEGRPIIPGEASLLQKQKNPDVIKSTKYSDAELNTVVMTMDAIDKDCTQVDGGRTKEEILKRIEEIKKSGKVPVVVTQTGLTADIAVALGSSSPEHIDKTGACSSIQNGYIIWNESGVRRSYEAYNRGFGHQVNKAWGVLSEEEFRHMVIQHEMTHLFGKVDGTLFDEAYATIVALERIGRYDISKEMRNALKTDALRAGKHAQEKDVIQMFAENKKEDGHLWQPLDKSTKFDPNTTYVWTGNSVIGINSEGVITHDTNTTRIGALVDEAYSKEQKAQFVHVTADEAFLEKVRNEREEAVYTVLANVMKAENPSAVAAIQQAYDQFAMDRNSVKLMGMFSSLSQFYGNRHISLIVEEMNLRGLSDPSFIARWDALKRAGLNSRRQAETGTTQRVDSRDINAEEFNLKASQWYSYLVNVGIPIEQLKGKDPTGFLEDFKAMDANAKKQVQFTLDANGMQLSDIENIARIVGTRWDEFVDNPALKQNPRTLAESMRDAREKLSVADNSTQLGQNGTDNLAKQVPDELSTADRVEEVMTNLVGATQAHMDIIRQVRQDISDKMSHLDYIKFLKYVDGLIPKMSQGLQDDPVGIINDACVMYLSDLKTDDVSVISAVEKLKEDSSGEVDPESLVARIQEQIKLERSINSEIEDSKALLKTTREVADSSLYEWKNKASIASVNYDNAEMIAKLKTSIENLIAEIEKSVSGELKKPMVGDDFYAFPDVSKNAPNLDIAGAAWYTQLYAKYLNQSANGWSWLPGALDQNAFSLWLARQSNVSQIDSPEFASIKSMMKQEVFSAMGGFEYSSVMADIVGKKIQDTVLKIAKGDVKKAAWYQDWLSTFARDVYQHTPGNPSAYSLSAIGEGGLYYSENEKKAFLKYYPEVFTELTGREPSPAELASWQKERPREAYWKHIPYELKQLILWVNAQILDPIKTEGEKMGIFENSNNYMHALMGWTPRFAYRTVAQEKKVSRDLSREKNPAMQYRTEEEYRMVSTSGQASEKGVNFNIANYHQAVSHYVLDKLNAISRYNLLQKMGAMENPALPGVNMVTYEYKIHELAKKGVITLPKNEDNETMNAKKWLEDNGYVQSHNMSGLAEHYRGTFRVPWVHNSLKTSVDALTDNYQRPAWQKALLLANQIQKITVMFFPAQFMYAIAEGVILAPNVKMSDRIKGLVKVITSSLPTTIASAGWTFGAALGLGGGLLGGSAVGLLAGAALGITVGAMTPSVIKRSWDMLSGIAKPWEMYKGMNPKIVEMALRNNVQMVGLRSAYSVIYDRVKAYQDSLTPAMTPTGRRVMQWMLGKFGMDDYAFQDVIPKLILTYYDGLSKSLLKKGMPEEDAYRIAAQTVNRTAGSLASFAMSASERDLMRLYTFATDYTLSEISVAYLGVNGLREHIADLLENMGILSKERANVIRMKDVKTPKTWVGKVVSPMVGAEMSTTDRRMVAKQLLAWNVKAVFNAMIWKTIIQWALSGADDDKDKRWNLWEAMFGNAMGRQCDIRLPWRDKDGREVYVGMSIFKELKNYQQSTGIGVNSDWSLISWAENIGEYIWMKAAFLPKLGVAGAQQAMGLEGRGGDPFPLRSLIKESLPAFAQGNGPFGTPATMFSQSLGQNVFSQPYNKLKDELQYRRNRELISKQTTRQKDLLYQMRRQPSLEKAKAFYNKHQSEISPTSFLNEMIRRKAPEYYQVKQNLSTLMKAKARK